MRTQSNRQLWGGVRSPSGSLQVGLSSGLQKRGGCTQLRLEGGQKQQVFLLQYVDQAPFLEHV